MSHPVRIALLGAGIFARDAHIPALLSCGDAFQIVAIYSRNLATAQARVADVPYPVEATDDLAALMAREDIDALDILLPIDVQAAVVEQALDSGKHILSEKPIAPDIASAQALIARYDRAKVWMVGENYRYEPTFLQAADLLRAGAVGRPLTVSMARHIPFMPESKYYATAWRRSGKFPGGLLVDGGVHHIAGLRLMLGEITQVSAFTTLFRADLPPVDAISASLVFEDGVLGSYLVNYSSGIGQANDTVIHGEDGVLRVDRGKIEITDREGTRTLSPGGAGSVDAEMAAFAAAVRDGAAHRNTPEAGLQDLAVMEALLHAADSGAVVEVARFV